MDSWAAFQPLHAGHAGGGTFDSFNLTVGAVVLVVLALVGFLIYRVIKRRRELDEME